MNFNTEVKKVKNNTRKVKLSFNSPIVLGFTILCFVALALNWVTKGWANRTFFSVYHSSLLSPFTYIRMFGHVVGPLLEEKYGSSNILFVILTTALVTGIVNYVFFPHVQLLGASGVVFAFILLSPFTGVKEGTVPVTLLLVGIIYIGGQIYEGLFVYNNVANLTHILGGLVGGGLGYVMHKNKMNRY